MACYYFSVPANSLVAAQMHKMVFRHVSLLCTLGAARRGGRRIEDVQEPRKLRYAYALMLRIPCGRETEKTRSEDALINGQK